METMDQDEDKPCKIKKLLHWQRKVLQPKASWSLHATWNTTWRHNQVLKSLAAAIVVTNGTPLRSSVTNICSRRGTRTAKTMGRCHWWSQWKEEIMNAGEQQFTQWRLVAGVSSAITLLKQLEMHGQALRCTIKETAERCKYHCPQHLSFSLSHCCWHGPFIDNNTLTLSYVIDTHTYIEFYFILYNFKVKPWSHTHSSGISIICIQMHSHAIVTSHFAFLI